MNLQFPYLYYYLIFAFGVLALMVVFVPKAEIKKLFWFGLLWGSATDFVFEHIYHFIKLTMYQHMTPFNVGVLPIWTILAWTPTVVLFIYLMPNEKGRVHFWLYLLVWSAFTSFVAVILTQLDLLVFLKGGPWIWFVASLIFLYLASKHHLYLQSKRTDKI